MFSRCRLLFHVKRKLCGLPFLLLLFLIFPLKALQVGPLVVYSDETEPFYGAIVVSHLQLDEWKQIKVRVSPEAYFKRRDKPFLDYFNQFTFQILDLSKSNKEGLAAIIVKNDNPPPKETYKEIPVFFTLRTPNSGEFTRLFWLQTTIQTKEATVETDIGVSLEESLGKEANRGIDIVKHDNLQNVARAVKNSYYLSDAEISESQIMTSIRRVNPEAFASNDSYRLLENIQVNLPTLAQIKSQSFEEAQKEIQSYYKQKDSTVGVPGHRRTQGTLVVGNNKKGDELENTKDTSSSVSSFQKKTKSSMGFFFGLFSKEFIQNNLFLIIFVGLIVAFLVALIIFWSTNRNSDDLDLEEDYTPLEPHLGEMAEPNHASPPIFQVPSYPPQANQSPYFAPANNPPPKKDSF